VFCREDGTPIWPRTFSRAFERYVNAAHLPAFRLHDLRHTHASLALQAGVHPKVVSERLGHAYIGDHPRHLQPRDPGAARGCSGKDGSADR
jgi:integrase